MCSDVTRDQSIPGSEPKVWSIVSWDGAEANSTRALFRVSSAAVSASAAARPAAAPASAAVSLIVSVARDARSAPMSLLLCAEARRSLSILQSIAHYHAAARGAVPHRLSGIFVGALAGTEVRRFSGSAEPPRNRAAQLPRAASSRPGLRRR